MHIVFKAKDSLYKIFKIIKKIPPYKKAVISIDKNHELFEHKWWAKQLADLLREQHIDAIFRIDTKKQATLFENAGLAIEYKHKQGIMGVWEQITNRFFSSKSIHQQLMTQKNTKAYLILAAEIAVLVLIGIFLLGLISTKATITVTPSNQIIPVVYQYELYPAGSEPSNQSILRDQLTIPYYQGEIEYTQELTVDVQDITYEYSQAQGRIEFQNTLETAISLVGGTGLETEDGVLFELDSRVNIPAGTPDNPGRAYVGATARSATQEGIGIGEQSNIPAGTKLLISNLEESLVDEAIIGYAETNFSGGETIEQGVVIQEDINAIEERIIQSMENNKRSHLQEHLSNNDQTLNLPYDDLITLEVAEFITTTTAGDNATFVDGLVRGKLQYYYIKEEDFYAAVDEYIQDRPLPGKFLINYDPFSIEFYPYSRRDDDDSEHFLIPISINAIRGYNFIDDTFNLGEEMVNLIQGMNRDNARNTLLGYDQVRDVDISIAPRWYDTLPDDTDRITIKHTTQ